MIDFHTHSLLSDGLLLPSELVRRAEVTGYKAIGITDHVDVSNIDFVLPRIQKFCADIAPKLKIKVLPGIELTHIQPNDFKKLVNYAREQGCALVVGHGQTIAEPVLENTNKAAIEAGVDILAHPGIISTEDAKLAAEQGVYLEISARKGHSLSNGHVVKTALKTGAKLVLNTDAHAPEDLITQARAYKIAQAAGLDIDQLDDFLTKNIENLLKIVEKRLS